ncbi:MAG: hypothetical protein QM778_19810 [Myxococcales bacterium]
MPLGAPDASTMGPEMDASMDSGAAHPDAGPKWDPDSGLPRECVEPPPALIDPALLARCPSCEGDARCVPKLLIEKKAPEMLAKLGSCDDKNVCVPDPIIASMGFYKPDSCRSVNDSEGRCMSECLPAVAAQRDILPQAGCATHERCVPCFDPLKGEETGACRLTCDLGPVEPAKTLSPCCGGLGTCVPSGLVPSDQASLLTRDSCVEENTLCAPSVLMDDQAKPSTCSSVAGYEGRCLPACLPSIAAKASKLPADVCQIGEVCAPCFDPFDGSDSGACRIHGDAPAQPAATFSQCCGELGTCVPSSLVGADDASRLPKDSCAQADSLCVPKAFLDSSFVPPSCRSLGNSEGRCVATCMLPTEQRSAPLPQSSCAVGELCAPCFNPVDGAATSVCSIRGDAPKEPVLRFDTICCGSSGLCIPQELSGNNAKSLPVDRCGTALGAGWVCAPKRVVADPTRASNPFNSCKISLGFFSVGRGKCVPNCMVEASGFAKRLLQRSSCESGESCVPCSIGGVPGC